MWTSPNLESQFSFDDDFAIGPDEMWACCEPGASLAIGDAVIPAAGDMRVDRHNLLFFRGAQWMSQ